MNPLFKSTDTRTLSKFFHSFQNQTTSRNLKISSPGNQVMSKIYVGGLDSRTTEEELEDEFRAFGVLRSVWVARKPPGYAFIEFDDRRDAEDAIRALDGKKGWRVELSRSRGSGGGGPRGGGGRGRGGGDLKCYECGESGHFARECRSGTGSGRSSRGRRGSPPQHRRSSPEYGRSPPRRSRSPYRSSVSPKRAHNYSKSPPSRRERDVSPHANGSAAVGRERYRSRS